jgi:hypothetical protein
MNCKYCGKPVGLLRKLAGQSFCSDGHQKKFKEEHEALALRRLEESWTNTQMMRAPTLAPPDLPVPGAASAAAGEAGRTIPAAPPAAVDAAPPANTQVPAGPDPVVTPGPAGPEAKRVCGFLSDFPANARPYATVRAAGAAGVAEPEPHYPELPRLAAEPLGAPADAVPEEPPVSGAVEVPLVIPAAAAAEPVAALAWAASTPQTPDLPRHRTEAFVGQPLQGENLAIGIPEATALASRFEVGAEIAAPVPKPVQELASGPGESDPRLPDGVGVPVGTLAEDRPAAIASFGPQEIETEPRIEGRTISGWADWNAGLQAWMDDFLATWFPEDAGERTRPVAAGPAEPPLAGRCRILSIAALRGAPAGPVREVQASDFPVAPAARPGAPRRPSVRVLRSRTAPVPLSLRVPEVAGLPCLEPERSPLSGRGAA